MKITIEYTKVVEKEIKIPKEQQKNFKAWLKDEDERTTKHWDRAESFWKWLENSYSDDVGIINY